ncbi:hypothetical protein N9250_01675 [bacterium]|nr:hypothetical protein [bacterium]
MTNVINFKDHIDLDGLSEFEAILLQTIRDSQAVDFDPIQFVLLAVSPTDDEQTSLVYSFDPHDESMMIAIGYLTTLVAHANNLHMEELGDD